ncbi:MAG: hypothetical protein D6686_03435 [Alphaproteobacteria bacterium]|nr:MAG: hypothetical protein D6686_03435 [Alphaproteobacteria bacterium]
MPRAPAITLPLAAFAAALAFVVAGGVMAGDVALFRAHATAWMSALMAMPAMWHFLRRAGRRPLGQSWRLWWTAGWLMIVIHMWWGLGALHQWDAASVFARQGLAIAGPTFLLELVWTVDVVLAWTRRDWADARGWAGAWHWFAWALAAACFFVSLILFRNDAASLWTGALMLAVLLSALLRRLAAMEEA